MLALALLGIDCTAQRGEVKGMLVDSVGEKATQHAVISVVRLGDSTLVGFTRSDADGGFVLKGLPGGSFFLFVTHPQFSERSIPINISGDGLVDLGRIFLPPRSSTLAAAIVTRRKPLIRLKGDTVEYDAANVKTKINATVEDLLKQLPGIEVDQKGGITAQGQKIQKILLDGEEFFSEDPTIATRNLSASMVDKVQVLNKKSAQADFTGIDDGKTTKTLNLTLLNNSKHGYFGKAEAGTDANQYYNTDALAGAFKAKRKLAVFAMASNTGQSSLSGTDGQSFDDGESVSVPAPPGGDNFGPSGAVGGVPQTANAGVHYSNKWNGGTFLGDQHLSGNYRYNSILNNASSFTFTQQTLPDSIYTQTQQANSVSTKVQHCFSGIYELAFDSSSSLRLSFGDLTEQGHNQDIFTDTTHLNNIVANSSQRTSDAHIDNSNMVANILWRKKFTLPGQTFSADARFQRSDQHTYGHIYSLDSFYQGGGSQLSSDTTDQKKDNSARSLGFQGNMLYTTPIWKSWLLATGYNFTLTQNQSLNSTWNKGTGKYDDYIDSLGSQYTLRIVTQRLRLTAQKKTQHFTYTFGGDLSYDAYQQMDQLADTSFRYHYLNLFPQVEVRYNVSPFRTLSLSYYGNTQQPSIYQLQSEKINNDPLNIILGNPSLQPAFTHSFGFALNNCEPLVGRVMYVGINVGFTTNNISSSSLIDGQGRTITQSVNTNGNKSLSLYSYYSRNLQNLRLRIGLNTNLAYSRDVNFVNNLKNLSDIYSPAAGLSIGRNIPDKYNFNINSNVGYSYSRSSINSVTPSHYWTESYSAGIGWTLPEKIEISTTCNYTWRQKITFSDNLNQSFLWDAFLNKNFQNKSLTARVTINDILNQSKGLNNTLSGNQLTQSSFIAFHRYCMVSIIWNVVARGESKTLSVK